MNNRNPYSHNGSGYSKIAYFGQGAANNPANNPLTYCLDKTVDSEFLHGAIAETISGPHGRNCQAFMSQYCAEKWDGICEYKSRNISTNYPNTLQNCEFGCSEVELKSMTAGDILIRNTASRKYLTQMFGQCRLKTESFDPTVPSSPMISYFAGSYCGSQGNGRCVPVYEVNPSQIDDDPVMNKILQRPIIALGILVNIYNTAKRKNTYNNLIGTKLYNFFETAPFQKYIQGVNAASSNNYIPVAKQFVRHI